MEVEHNTTWFFSSKMKRSKVANRNMVTQNSANSAVSRASFLDQQISLNISKAKIQFSFALTNQYSNLRILGASELCIAFCSSLAIKMSEDDPFAELDAEEAELKLDSPKPPPTREIELVQATEDGKGWIVKYEGPYDDSAGPKVVEVGKENMNKKPGQKFELSGLRNLADAVTWEVEGLKNGSFKATFCVAKKSKQPLSYYL
eukprot:g70873.t1